jgi:hypothetical protein
LKQPQSDTGFVRKDLDLDYLSNSEQEYNLVEILLVKHLIKYPYPESEIRDYISDLIDQGYVLEYNIRDVIANNWYKIAKLLLNYRIESSKYPWFDWTLDYTKIGKLIGYKNKSLGYPELEWALNWNNADMVKLLIKHGLTLKSEDHDKVWEYYFKHGLYEIFLYEDTGILDLISKSYSYKNKEYPYKKGKASGFSLAIQMLNFELFYYYLESGMEYSETEILTEIKKEIDSDYTYKNYYKYRTTDSFTKAYGCIMNHFIRALYYRSKNKENIEKILEDYNFPFELDEYDPDFWKKENKYNIESVVLKDYFFIKLIEFQLYTTLKRTIAKNIQYQFIKQVNIRGYSEDDIYYGDILSALGICIWMEYHFVNNSDPERSYIPSIDFAITLLKSGLSDLYETHAHSFHGEQAEIASVQRLAALYSGQNKLAYYQLLFPSELEIVTDQIQSCFMNGHSDLYLDSVLYTAYIKNVELLYYLISEGFTPFTKNNENDNIFDMLFFLLEGEDGYFFEDPYSYVDFSKILIMYDLLLQYMGVKQLLKKSDIDFYKNHILN